MILHKWVVQKDTGYTKYMECAVCGDRGIFQPNGAGSQPIDETWMAGHRSRVFCDFKRMVTSENTFQRGSHKPKESEI